MPATLPRRSMPTSAPLTPLRAFGAPMPRGHDRCRGGHPGSVVGGPTDKRNRDSDGRHEMDCHDCHHGHRGIELNHASSSSGGALHGLPACILPTDHHPRSTLHGQPGIRYREASIFCLSCIASSTDFGSSSMRQPRYHGIARQSLCLDRRGRDPAHLAAVIYHGGP